MQDLASRLEAAEARANHLEQAAFTVGADARATAAQPQSSGPTGTGALSPAHLPAPAEGEPARQETPAPDSDRPRAAAASGSAQASGGSKEAAQLRGVLLRFSHDSFEIGMGPQQIQHLLELLNMDVQEVAQAVMVSMKPQQTDSNTTEDFVMLCSSGEGQTERASDLENSSMATHEQRVKISSQVMLLMFNNIIARPMTALGHALQSVEQLLHAADGDDAALLASLLCSDACTRMYTQLLNLRSGTSEYWDGTIRTGSVELGRQLASIYPCPAPNLETLVYRSLLVGFMVPATHPSLRFICTVASQGSGQPHPFNAEIHKRVHEVPGLDPDHPVARVVIGCLLPGVAFWGEADSLIRERVVTMAKEPCLE